VQIFVGAGTELGAAPGELRIARFNGGGPPVGQVCPVRRLNDDFEDGVEAIAWSRSWQFGQSVKLEAGGTAIFLPRGGSCAYRTSGTYDMTGQAVTIQVTEMLHSAADATAFFRVQRDASHWLDLAVTQGWLRAEKMVAGETIVLAEVGYDPLDRLRWREEGARDPPPHGWWRLREADGVVSWETSPDGMVWQTHHAEPVPFSLTEVDISFGATNLADEDVGRVRFDNYNLAPRE
jgi:hypothetical protein